MISLRAGLKKVPWDGYLKYSRPSSKHSERKYVQHVFLSRNPTVNILSS